MKTHNTSKEVIDQRMKVILGSLRGDNTQRKEFISGIILGYGYDTMVEFLEDCIKQYGLCNDVMEIASMYYLADFDDKTKSNMRQQLELKDLSAHDKKILKEDD